jgi:hypothetical protein
LQAAFCSLSKKIIYAQLFDTGVETLLKTMFGFGEFQQDDAISKFFPTQPPITNVFSKIIYFHSPQVFLEIQVFEMGFILK